MELLDAVVEEVRVAKDTIGSLRKRVAELEALLQASEAEVIQAKAELAECRASQPEPTGPMLHDARVQLGDMVAWESGDSAGLGNLVFSEGATIELVKES